MFSNLFSSKLEKDLKALQDRGRELELRFEDGESLAISQLLKVLRNKVVILGFREKLKNPNIICTFLHNGASFKTKVMKKGVDSNGNSLFYCALPEGVKMGKIQRHLIKGKESQCKVLVSTNKGDKSVLMPVWEITELGATLVNNSNVHINIGTKLFQTMMNIGTGGQAHLVDLQVAGTRKEGSGQMLICAFSREPRGKSEMLSAGKGLAPKPKPPTK